MSLTIAAMVFPWPDARLSPNKRFDRRALIWVKGNAKNEAYAITLESKTVVLDTDLQLTLTFYPPDRRKRDLDNLYATFKAYQDGMFLALGIDDCKIERVILQRGNPIPGGQVFVDIREA
jgi:crossover junction endodeoxyribonuclease RusA